MGKQIEFLLLSAELWVLSFFLKIESKPRRQGWQRIRDVKVGLK